MIKSITIENFRGFGKAKNKIEFALPNGRDIGSGLTVIVGPNNSGKTTIFDALCKLAPSSQFGEKERKESSLKLIFEDDEENSKILKNRDLGSLIETEGNNSISFQNFIFTEKREWNAKNANYSEIDNYNYLEIQRSNHLHKSGEDSVTLHRLKNICNNTEHKELLTEFMRDIIPNFYDWTIEYDEANYIKYFSSEHVTHEASKLGKGTFSLFKFYAQLITGKVEKQIICIDEPELYLHPQAQKMLSQKLSDAAKDTQIIITTHSPHFINIKDIQNGANIVRLNKYIKEDCQAFLFKEHKNLKGLLHDKLRPYLFDYVAKEIFFAESILFVEGQDDAALLNHFINIEGLKILYNVFGYGVNGASNMPSFLKIAKEIGLKAAAIFDNDQQNLKNECQRDFPKFFIDCLETDDIRDKEASYNSRTAKPVLAKEGYFSSEGNIKPHYKLKLINLLETINNHIKTQ